jgi:endonuclease/exonuclease/phosphatase (EEP) superfamily protein YafD
MVSADSYALSFFAAAAQPLWVVYATALICAIAKRAYTAAFVMFCCITALCVFLLSTQWPAVASGQQQKCETFRAVQLNAGEIQDATAILDWLAQAKADVLFVSQGDHNFLGSSGLAELFPHRTGRLSHDILSRFPLDEPAAIGKDTFVRRIAPGVPVVIATLPKGGQVLLAAPNVPSPRSKELWDKGSTSLAQTGGMLLSLEKSTGLPVLAAGDFNSTPQGRGYRAFKRLSGLVDASPNWLRSGTWPTRLPKALGIAIDHIFISESLRVAWYRVGPSLGGDHRPVIVDLVTPTHCENQADSCCKARSAAESN